MNKKDSLHYKTSWKLLYYRYKDTSYYSVSIFVLTISACILLLFYIVIPQISQWFSLQQEISSVRKGTETIMDNKALLQQSDDGILTQELRVVTTAFPSEKDFAGILSAVSAAASFASITLEDYSFSVGELQSDTQKEVSPIALILLLNGSFYSTIAFLKKLQTSLPLSEVVTVDFSEGNSVIEIIFFYKPFPKIVYNETSPLTPITRVDEEFIRQLEIWKPQSTQEGQVTEPKE